MVSQTRAAMMLCPRCWGQPPATLRTCDRCEGRGLVPDVRLSRSFTLVEMVASRTARRLGIANDPGSIHIRRLRELCEWLLQPVRDALGPMQVTSGYRAPDLNRAVGGSASSAHLTGWAADVRPVQVEPVEVMRWLTGSGVAWDQAILYPGHVHLGWRRPVSGVQRGQLLVAQGASFPPWRDDDDR